MLSRLMLKGRKWGLLTQRELVLRRGIVYSLVRWRVCHARGDLRCRLEQFEGLLDADYVMSLSGQGGHRLRWQVHGSERGPVL